MFVFTRPSPRPASLRLRAKPAPLRQLPATPSRAALTAPRSGQAAPGRAPRRAAPYGGGPTPVPAPAPPGPGPRLRPSLPRAALDSPRSRRCPRAAPRRSARLARSVDPASRLGRPQPGERPLQAAEGRPERGQLRASTQTVLSYFQSHRSQCNFAA